MTVLPLRPDTVRRAGPPFLWDRQMRPAIDAMTARPGTVPRLLLVGNRGGGKSTTLRHLRDLLTDLEHEVHVARRDTPIDQVPHGDVLLVDDLHLFEERELDLLLARAADPDAALIATLRPWPTSEKSRLIARTLEKALPPVVLGHVERSDVLQHLDGHGCALPESCMRHILQITGGVSWLVSEALAQHDERDCVDDDAHIALRRAVSASISHRLDTIEGDLRRVVEEICVAPAGHVPAPSGSAAADLVLRAHAEGLLLRSGQPAPLVRSAVRETISAERLTELGRTVADALVHFDIDGHVRDDWFWALHDTTIGSALMQHGDRMLATHPARAADLYRAAVNAGADPGALVPRQAQAAWASGDLDAAVAIAQAAPVSTRDDDRERLTNVSAGVWAARGMMAQSHASYRAHAPTTAESAALAMIAAVGIGDRDGVSSTAVQEPADLVAPSTLSVSMDLLRRGLAGSITAGRSESVLADLVRAAEMYTSARASDAVPELPAVIATVVSLNLGAMVTAQAVIDDAIRGQHGGSWARPRLLLWRAWVAVQRARPAEARDALARAEEIRQPLSARDALLASAVRIAIARRYEDASGLEAAWRHASGAILRVDMDLYLLHPLAELISSATRVGDTERVHPHFTRALEITSALGEPSLWTTHLRWAGIQQGILLGRPGHVSPHAKALVAASADSHVATVMARAGRVWTSVLGGTVDASAVETAAAGLASIGLKWDGARLAGHGAARTDDRKVAARLLACARELHPTDGIRRPAPTETHATADDDRSAAEDILSEREIEVARLVLQGKTYAEIGEAIYISPRTAEHHIAHIRQRLGATSRSDVIAKLRHLLGSEQTAGGRGLHPAVDASPSTPLRVSG